MADAAGRRVSVRGAVIGEGMRKAFVVTGDETLDKAYSGVVTDILAQSGELTRRDILQRVLKKRTSDAKGCVILPTAIGFFVLYAIGMQLHNDMTMVYRLESAIRGRIDRSFQEVETIADVWHWLSQDALATMFVQEDMYGDPLPLTEWNRVLTFNQLQGSVVVTQSRTGSGSWGSKLQEPLDDLTRSFQNAEEGFVPVDESRRMFRRLHIMRAELIDSLPGPDDGDYNSEYQVAIYPGATLAEIRTKLNYLDQRGWIDKDTGALTIRALILNAELGRPVLEKLTLLISFSRGGGIYYKISMQPFFLEAFGSSLSILVDVIWGLMLIGTTLSICVELWAACAANRVLVYMTQFDTIIQLMLTIGGWAIVVAFILVQFSYTSVIESRLVELREAVAEEGRVGQVGAAGSQEASERLHEAVEDSVTVVIQYYTANSWFTLLLMLRFFYAFRAQPRLSVVTDTLRATFVDLLHFLVVFTPSFIAYVISGNLIFGRRLEEFSTIRSSIGACFRIVIENEFEWERLSEEHFITTAIWVWTFLVVVVLVMLNMVLAIILDIYNDVRQKVDSADTIFLFFNNLRKRVWNNRNWLPDAKLDEFLSKMQGSATLSRDDLYEMLPTLTHTQTEMLFKACRNTTAFMAKQDMSRGLLLQLSTSIRMSVDRVNDFLRQHGPSPQKSMSDKPWRKHKPPLRKWTGNSGSTNRSKGSKGSGPSAVRSKRSLPTKAKNSIVAAETRLPTRLEKRLEGAARTFPGMPKVGGSCNVPLLPPLDASNERPDQATRPPWLQEIDQLLDNHEQSMLELQTQLQVLHERVFEQTQRLASGLLSQDPGSLVLRENVRDNAGDAAAREVAAQMGLTSQPSTTSINTTLRRGWTDSTARSRAPSLSRHRMLQIL